MSLGAEGAFPLDKILNCESITQMRFILALALFFRHLGPR